MLVYLKSNLRGRKFAVDQGFPRSGETFELLGGSYSEKSAEKLSPLLREHLLMMATVYISLRQAAEWGMRSLQGSFPRLKARLLADEKKRKFNCIINRVDPQLSDSIGRSQPNCHRFRSRVSERLSTLRDTIVFVATFLSS